MGYLRGLDALVEKHPDWLVDRLSLNSELNRLLNKITCKSKPVLLQALPKTGGSWLSNVLSDLTGCVKVQKKRLTFGKLEESSRWSNLTPYFRDTGIKDAECLAAYLNKPVLLHLHLLPLIDNKAIVTSGNFNVLYLSRDMVEVMESLYFHLRIREGQFSKELANVTQENGIKLVLDHFLDLFCEFDVQWRKIASSRKDIPLLEYNEVLDNPQEELVKALASMGYEVDAFKLDLIIKKYAKPEKSVRSDMLSSIKLRALDEKLDWNVFDIERIRLRYEYYKFKHDEESVNSN